MTRKLLTGNQAAAWGARLAEVDYFPAFPITPQTEIVESLAAWIDAGEVDCRMVTLDSEHSMLTAAATAAATGVRVFTATSSQGLLYAMEMLYALPGMRVPLVLVNVSRALATPITLEPDHTDILAARDTGFIQLHCATCQEVLDAVLLAYRVAEDERVRLPVLVNLDGFYLSFTREPVRLPDLEAVRDFLPAFDSGPLHFGAKEPQAQGVSVLGGAPYSYFRYETHLACQAALDALHDHGRDFGARFGRHWSPVETWHMDDADYAIVIMGSFATKAKEAVEMMRSHGWRVGVVRPRVLRPLPAEALNQALRGLKGAAVVDQNLAIGYGGVLYGEVITALYSAASPQEKRRMPALVSFVGGLGGRDIVPSEFHEMIRVAREAAASGTIPPPRLLFTEQELEATRTMQDAARAS